MGKKLPSYWWDFGEDGEIIVESDDDRFPVVGRFHYVGTGNGCATQAIAQAEQRIIDLRSGRLDPRKCT